MSRPNDSSNFEMTKEEVKAFQNAMQKPEFVNLLSDYMNEISDPKNKEEYDQYLQQLERDQELPKGMKLLNPEPSFCIKTLLKNKKDKNFETKFFINICQTKELAKPSFEDKSSNGQTGRNFKLPLMTNKPRYDQDKNKKVCSTIDIAFHPEAIMLAKNSKTIEKFLCTTAIDSAEKQLIERGEILSRDYKILKKLACKGGKPATMTIAENKLKCDPLQNENQPPTEKRQKTKDVAPKMYQEFIEKQKIMKNQEEAKDQKIVEKIEENKEENKNKIEDLANSFEDRIETPKYKFVYSYESEYYDFIEKREEKNLKRPKNICFEIFLPKIKNINDARLDINRKELILDIPSKYFLQISFAFEIIQDKGTAKFDTKTNKLKITLPIDNSVEIEKKEEISQNITNDELILDEETESNSPLGKDIKREVGEKINANQQELTKPSYSLLEVTEKKNSFKLDDNGLSNDKKIEENFLSEKKHKVEEIIENAKEDINFLNNEKENKTSKINENEIYKLKYLTQENSECVFLIVNIPSYEKEKFIQLVFQNQLYLKYENQSKIYYAILNYSDLDVQAIEVNFVTDYIVFNFFKKNTSSQELSQALFIKNLEVEYQQFESSLKIAIESKQGEEREKKKMEEIYAQQFEPSENKDNHSSNELYELKKEDIEISEKKIEETSERSDNIGIQFIQFNPKIVLDID